MPLDDASHAYQDLCRIVSGNSKLGVVLLEPHEPEGGTPARPTADLESLCDALTDFDFGGLTNDISMQWPICLAISKNR